MTDDAEDLPAIDAARVLADRAALTPETRAALYRRVFGTEAGQVVLIDLLANAGVATPRPHTMSADERFHLDGQAWAALNIVLAAGYDVGAISAALINSSLRGLNSNVRSEPVSTRLPGSGKAESEPLW